MIGRDTTLTPKVKHIQSSSANFLLWKVTPDPRELTLLNVLGMISIIDFNTAKLDYL